jgi:hypothetical protein
VRTVPARKAVAIAATLVVLLLVGLGVLLSSCGGATTPVSSEPVAAPQFSGVTLDGKTVALDEFRGKPLFLVYMTSG